MFGTKADHTNYEVTPFPKNRRLVTDIGRLAGSTPAIRGLIEIDVTKPRKLIKAYKEQSGKSISFTAYLAACVGKAVEDNKILHAIRNWRGQLVIFEDVDISIMVEVEKAGKKFPVGHIIRSANKKSLRQVHEEIRAAQTSSLKEREIKSLSYLNLLPGFIRRLLLRFLYLTPNKVKRYKGTVILSAVGMFGRGGGWGISLPTHTLGITVGGIATKPGIVDGQIIPRDYLNVTLDFDHDIVDGAPAARFAQRFRDIVESGDLLNDM